MRVSRRRQANFTRDSCRRYARYGSVQARIVCVAATNADSGSGKASSSSEGNFTDGWWSSSRKTFGETFSLRDPSLDNASAALFL